MLELGLVLGLKLEFGFEVQNVKDVPLVNAELPEERHVG
jgi:hypothetical protein